MIHITCTITINESEIQSALFAPQDRAGTTETLGMRTSKTLPGLGNFYMAGQWVEPSGGTVVAAMSGRYVTQIICKKDKRLFATTTP